MNIQSHEIQPGIHRIACPFGQRIVFCHLIVGAERTILVDTGMAYTPEKDLFPYMAKLGLSPSDLDLVVISHSDMDHQGGNDAVRQAAPQADFACHRLDAAWIESPEAIIAGRYSQFEEKHDIGYGEEGKAGIAADCQSHVPMDWHLQGGELLRIGPDRYITFVHTPGHTWGHIAIWDAQTSTLIAGEAALHTSILGLDGAPAMPPTYCYIDTYETTLQRLLAMPIAIYSPAHWPVQEGADVQTFLAESLHYCRETEEKVLIEIRRAAGPISLKELIQQLSDDLGDWPTESAQDLSYALAGHLERLRQRNLIQEINTSRHVAYAPID